MTRAHNGPPADWILRAIPDGLLVLDLEGRILFANARLLEMAGRVGQDLRGRLLSEVFDEQACRRIDPRLLALAGDAPQVHFNLELCGTDATARSYCFTATPLRDGRGRVVGVLEDFRGMDQLRKMILELEEVNRVVLQEKQKTQSIMDSLADGLFTVDAERRIRSFSVKLEGLTGIAADQAVGRTCMEVLRGTKCESDCPLSWSFEHEKTIDHCRETLRLEGRALPVSLTTAFLHDQEGRRVGLTAAVHDRSEVERLREALHQRHSYRSIIGRSRGMQELFQVIETVGDTEATVLITGESGTGKEVVAQAIHHRSPRAARPFLALNCAALNDNLLESELFGHVRGAFTGAVADKPSRFELAAGGTLFLDEIGDTTPALQSRLLRVLEKKTYERVGDTRTRTADVRIIAATHRDLRRLAEQGRFREDLYYRLAVVPVHLPPLRERREDIPLLVEHFMGKYRPRYFKGREEQFQGISNRALALMLEYAWPGNVRELEHAVEYAMISTTNNRIERAFLPLPLRDLQVPDQPAAAPPSGPPAPPAEEDRLLAALQRNRFNTTRTARELGISRTTLWRRLKQRNLTHLAS